MKSSPTPTLSIGRTEEEEEEARFKMKSHIVPELGTDREMIWVVVKLVRRKTLYLSSYYRPHVADEDSVDRFSESLDKQPQF